VRGYQASRDHGNADSGGIEDSLAGGVGVSQEKILASVGRTDSFCSPHGRDIEARWTGKSMGLLRRSLNDILRIELNDSALDLLQWRDFGNGLAMSRLAREGKRELILYRIAANAAADAFLKHEHIGGEFYLVLRGKIADETGEYVEGDVVFLDPQSVHRPRAVGDTVVLVLWPEGVRIVD
jgi:mannose-6-phosphate isomerase-like protein (cupin superfamily)